MERRDAEDAGGGDERAATDPSRSAILLILLFVPAFFLLLYGYALNFDIRNVRLAVQDSDRSARSRELVSSFVNSGYFALVGYVDSPTSSIVWSTKAGCGRSCRFLPASSATCRLRQPVTVQVIIDGDNANTASTVTRLCANVDRPSTAPRRWKRMMRLPAPARRSPSIGIEPRIWYNPQLRSTLFLVPGLIAYISMITAVVSTALSVVREKERGTMEQVRMAPLSPLPYIIGKTMPYLVISFVSAILVILSAMLLFELPMRGSWLLLCGAIGLFLVGAQAQGLADLDHRRHAAGRVSDRALVVAAADDDSLGLHLSDLEHADGGAVDHPHRAGAATSSSRCGRSC